VPVPLAGLPIDIFSSIVLKLAAKLLVSFCVVAYFLYDED
jgi:hypothetical protein